MMIIAIIAIIAQANYNVNELVANKLQLARYAVLQAMKRQWPRQPHGEVLHQAHG